ncbi:unnamed protein product [Orchesella dallaii]|uniref:Sodium/nucleoside cotransporter n=1 Tax=Orchesella dallaii TaxID=48710 RepID=A0ABP1RK50_9HEXA
MANRHRTSSGADNPGFELDEKGKNPNDYGSIRQRPKKVSVAIPEGEDDQEIKFEDLPFDPNSMNIVARIYNGIRMALYNLVSTNKSLVKKLMLALIFILYNAYFITAILYKERNDLPWEWCDGHGLLIILTALTYWGLLYYHVIKPYFGKAINNAVLKPINGTVTKVFKPWPARLIAVILVVGAIVAFVVTDAWDQPRRLVSAGGVIVVLLLGLLLSQNPARVMWRQVFGGMLIQFVFGLLILRWEGGREFLDCVSLKVTTFLDFSNEGSSFVYGYLASGSALVGNGTTFRDLVGETIAFDPLFAFQGLSVIYFFSFFVGLLYHLGIMTWIVMKVGWLLQVFLGTTAAESMNAAANIFLGQTEAPILVKPFLNDMTKSELHAVMTGGFSTIAGTVMAAYISFGVAASSLLTASLMAAPAALAMSKLICPETQVTKTSAKDIAAMNTKSSGNALDAAAQGASQGFVLIGNILASLIAVIAFVAFLNSIIAWFGILVGLEELSFEKILGKVFIPIAFILGVDTENIEDVAVLLGLKTVVNEFVAYQRLTQMDLTERSRRIAEYALCSFANFSSVGIQLGGMSTLAPRRRGDFSNVVWSALLSGTLATLMNACVAGTLLSV